MKSKLPVLFITHGSPMLAIEPGLSGQILADIGARIPQDKIKAVLVISAHWISRGEPIVSAALEPETIHDFGGFPPSLYQLCYPAKGSPEMANVIQGVMKTGGFDVKQDPMRGLDHGAWIPLRYMLPDALLPVLQLSMPWPMDARLAIDFGKALKPLREQGILIIASGSMTHNLYDLGNDLGEMLYIKPFVNWVEKAIYDFDLHSIENYRKLAPYAKQAHPTEEHFLPLIIALASSDKGENITALNGGTTYQAIAMSNYIFGL